MCWCLINGLVNTDWCLCLVVDEFGCWFVGFGYCFFVFPVWLGLVAGFGDSVLGQFVCLLVCLVDLVVYVACCCVLVLMRIT